MDAPIVCAIAAVARARAFLARPDATDRELEPPHPAFVGFRRMAYVWVDGGTLEPIGDRVRLWLDFLRTQGTVDVWLSLEADEAAVATSGEGTALWRVSDDEGSLTMRGAAAGVRPAQRPELAAAADGLARALAAAAAAATGLRRDDLERATAILASEGDGSEVSDVAWPYFLLPGHGYASAHRRLLAAAVSTWPARGDVTFASLRAAAAAAIVAVVNSPVSSREVRGPGLPHVK